MANLAMVIVGYSFMSFFTKVTDIPRNILFLIIFIFCVIGSFSIRNSIFDIFVMMAFGIIGYFMRLGIPVVTKLIAFILAQPFEEAMSQALVGSEGNPTVFVSGPISVFFLFLTVFSIWFTWRRSFQKRQG